jgi:hypothetical protein
MEKLHLTFSATFKDLAHTMTMMPLAILSLKNTNLSKLRDLTNFMPLPRPDSAQPKFTNLSRKKGKWSYRSTHRIASIVRHAVSR